MSEEQATPTTPSVETPPMIEDSSVELQVGARIKKSPKFIAAGDLHDIVKILVNVDKITPDEAVRRLNNMVEKGSLVIMPMLGTKRRA